MAVAKDNTYNELSIQKGDGFTHAILLLHSESSSCTRCRSIATATNAIGGEIPIQELLDHAGYEWGGYGRKKTNPIGEDAPLFALTHPGCRCFLKLISIYDKKAQAIIKADGSLESGTFEPLTAEAFEEFQIEEGSYVSFEERQKQIEEMTQQQVEQETKSLEEHLKQYEHLEPRLRDIAIKKVKELYQEKLKGIEERKRKELEESANREKEMRKTPVKKEEPKKEEKPASVINEDQRKKFLETVDKKKENANIALNDQLKKTQEELNKLNKSQLTTKEYNVKTKLLKKMKDLKKRLAERKSWLTVEI